MATKKNPPVKPVAKSRQSTDQRRAAAGGPSVHSVRKARIANRTEDKMTASQKQRADFFIEEYLQDFNGTQAFVRTLMREGREFEDIAWDYAANKASEMLRWPYVAYHIKKFQDERREGLKHIISKDEIHYVYKREMHDPLNKGATRVAAAVAAERSLYGDPGKGAGPANARGGVMVLPPETTLEDWEKETSRSQAFLKEEVRR